jgi:hypothetical protein
MNSQVYIPGVCNIGPVEIAARKRSGYIGLLVAVVIAAVLYFLGVPRWWRLLVFFPAVLSATGFMQAYSHFCVGFGMKGLFNFGPELGKTESVRQQEFRTKDRQRAQRLIFYSVILGAIAALAATYI